MLIQQVKSKEKKLQEEYEQLQDCSKMLQRQKGYVMPDDFPCEEKIEGEWTSLGQILERKDKILEREIPVLRQNLGTQERVVSEKIKTLYAEWTTTKPIQGIFFT